MNVLQIAAVGLLLSGSSAFAQSPAPEKMIPDVAPTGPMTAVVPLDSEAEFPPLKGYRFTQVLNTIAPHTGRPMHSHAGMPEIVRILSGNLTDQRKGGPRVSYGPGSTIVNAGGVEHMWANLGDEPVVFIATAIRAPGH